MSNHLGAGTGAFEAAAGPGIPELGEVAAPTAECAHTAGTAPHQAPPHINSGRCYTHKHLTTWLERNRVETQLQAQTLGSVQRLAELQVWPGDQETPAKPPAPPSGSDGLCWLVRVGTGTSP